MSFISIFLLAEGVRVFSFEMKRYISWLNQTKSRIVIQLVFAIVYNGIIISSGYYLYVRVYYGQPLSLANYIYFLVLGLLLTLIFTSIWNAYLFFEEWKYNKNRLEIANMQKLTAELQSLKSNVSPHFLFNSLSILKGLIDESSSLSKGFIDKFSDIFRYTLTRSNDDLSLLSDEMKFVESYLHIIQMRYKEGLHVDTHIDDKKLQSYVPWSSMQLLIENCIKHNAISLDTPLRIDIYSEGDYLVIGNNKNQKLGTVDKVGYGLTSLTKRYSIFTDRELLVLDSEEYFEVRIPLLTIESYENSHY